MRPPVGEQDQPGAGGARVPTAPSWGILDAFAVFAAWLAIQLLVSAALDARASLSRQMGAMLVSGVMILLLVGAFLRARGRAPAGRSVGLVRPGRGVLRRAALPLALGVFDYMAISFDWQQALQLVGLNVERLPPQPLVATIAESRSTWALVLAVAGASVAAPVVEEVVFRGVLYLPARRALGAVPAAVLVSVVFALAHGYVWGLPQLFVLSLVFVTLFERTGTLLASMAAHSAYNTFHLVLLLWVTGAGRAGP